MKKRRHSSSSSSEEDIPLIAIKSGSCKYEVINKKTLHKPTNEQCEICLKLFQNKYTYLVHNASHIIIPLIKLEFLPCKTCSKYFTSQEELDSHTDMYHPSQNVTISNNITEVNTIIENDIRTENDLSNTDFKSKENAEPDKGSVKKGYISVRKNLFYDNITNNFVHNIKDTSKVKEETEATINFDKSPVAKDVPLNDEDPSRSTVKTENVDETDGIQETNNIRRKIIFEDDNPALPSILNDIVDDCKNEMDLIEPSWLLNNLTYDNFDRDEDNQNDDTSSMFRPPDDISSIETNNLCMQIVADGGRLKTNLVENVSQYGGDCLQNGANMLHNGTGILPNVNIIQQPILFNFLQNNGDINQMIAKSGNEANIFPNSVNAFQYGVSNLQHGDHQFGNILFGNESTNTNFKIQNYIDAACEAALLKNNSNTYLNSINVTKNIENLIKNVTSNTQIVNNSANKVKDVSNVIDLTRDINDINSVTESCINCLQDGLECQKHGIMSQLCEMHNQQRNIKTQQYGAKSQQFSTNCDQTLFTIQNVQGGAVLHQSNKQNLQCVIQSQQCSVQSQQCSVQSQQCSVRSQQCSVQSQQCGVETRKHSVRKRKVSTKKNIEDAFPVWTGTKSIHYDELIKPGIFKCKKCCKIYPNRLKLLKHEPTHITFDRSKPDPCYVCERYVPEDAMKRHCASFHNGAVPNWQDDVTPKKCKICSLNAFNWSLHYDLYHSAERVEKTKKHDNTLYLCELCYKGMRLNFQEHKVDQWSKGLCVRCKKQRVAKRVYYWIKKPLEHRLKNIQKRLKMMR